MMESDLLGASEVAKLLGVSRQRAYQLMEAHLDFPKPVAYLQRGKLWSRVQVDLWRRQWRRDFSRKGGRPRHRQKIEAP